MDNKESGIEKESEKGLNYYLKIHFPCIGSLLIFLFVLCLLLTEPLPVLNDVKLEEKTLISLIQWGLNRQLTHASLTLSAIVGIFSMLRMKGKILKKNETKIAFGGFLALLFYEYTKLIRSFQIVNIWEKLLDIKIENLFKLDLLQDYFLNPGNYFIQALVAAFITFFLIRMYMNSSRVCA